MSSMDLFTASKDLLINYRDLFVIFNPTDEINVNNHLLLPINNPHGVEVGTYGHFALSFTWLALLLFLR